MKNKKAYISEHPLVSNHFSCKSKTSEDNSRIVLYGDQNSLFNNSIWMDSTEAAAYLRVSIGSLRNMVSQGKIRSYKLENRLRFKKSELDQSMKLSSQGDYRC